jgi:hypothetical protein
MRFTTIRAFRGLMLWNRALALLIMVRQFLERPVVPRVPTLRRDTGIRLRGERGRLLGAVRRFAGRLAKLESGEFPTESRKGAA